MVTVWLPHGYGVVLVWHLCGISSAITDISIVTGAAIITNVIIIIIVTTVIRGGVTLKKHTKNDLGQKNPNLMQTQVFVQKLCF